MKRTLRWLATLTAVAALSVSAALAEEASSDQYRGCDGYGAASSEGDGMTEYATVLFIFNPVGYGNTARGRTNLGNQGVADCTVALSDLSQKHWMRRISLLRARAAHRMSSTDTSGVQADLDEASAIAAAHKDNPFFVRSLGWGLDLMQAYALRKRGDQAKANEMAAQAMTARPYNRQTLYTALLAMGPNAGEEAIAKAQTDLARLVPGEIDNLFIRAIDTGRFADAIALYPQLAPHNEIGDLNIGRNDAMGRVWRDFLNAQKFWAIHSGVYAYALLATGKPAEALAALDAERARLAKATEPPPPLTAKEAKDSDAVALRQGTVDVRERAAKEGIKQIDEWARIIDLRMKIDQGKTEEVIAALRLKPLPKIGTSVEFLDALDARLPKPKKGPKPEPISARLKADLLRERLDIRETTPEKLIDDLPSAETSSRLPDYSAGSGTWFGGTDDTVAFDGYRAGKPDADGAIVVRFKGTNTVPASMIEEVALLRSAELALAAHKKGVLVLGREDIETTITTTYYSVALRTDPGGFQTALKVLFVDPEAMPEKFKNAAWRVFDAQTVYDALAPIYIKKKRR